MGKPTPKAIGLIYRFLRRYIAREGLPPTYREMATGTTYSIETVRKAVLALVEEGKITMKPRKQRGIQLVKIKGLSARDHDVLFLIRDYIAAFGHAPTRDEIARQLICSRSTVNRALRSLTDKQHIETNGRFQGIQIVELLEGMQS